MLSYLIVCRSLTYAQRTAAALERGGDLVMSGFLEADVPAIVSRAKELGMELVETASREGWQMVHVRKTE